MAEGLCDVPQVEKVPCTGWKEMSLTEKTRDWSFDVGDWSRRWHLNEKLLEASLSSTYLRVGPRLVRTRAQVCQRGPRRE